MGKTFFTSWVLWEKMVFILGASIILVIILGLIKLTYNKWRLRKYTAIAENKVALRREMQHTASVKRGRSQRQQIPFGVRALESGIEVDGVWISGTNTPSSMPGSPNIVPQAVHKEHTPEASSSSSDMARIEIPQPVHGYPGANHSASPSHNIPTTLDPSMLSEQQRSRQHASDQPNHNRPTYQPRHSSHLRFSNSLSPEDSEAFAALEGRPLAADRNGKRPKDRSAYDLSGEEYRDPISWSGHSKNSTSSETHSDANQPVQSKRLSNGYLQPASRQPPKIRTSNTYNPDKYKPVQLDPLASNTDSHMDDFGRLHVRNRESGMSVVYAPVEDSVSKRLASSQGSTHEVIDPFATPESSPKEDRNPVVVDAPPANQHSEMIDNGDIDYIQGHAQPLRPFDGNRQLRRSQVVRKVNSGFEILRPGTLATPRQSSDITDVREDYHSKPKKLQRRSRASSGSNFIEHV